MSKTQIKILIADDEPIGRELLEAILVPEGYDLIISKDGEDALNAAIEHKPDIILLDVMMPKMDGFEVCEHIRKTKETAHIPIFLITALDDRDSKIRGIDAGADDYISKPFDRIEILAKVKNSANLVHYRSQNKNEQQYDYDSVKKITVHKDLFENFCNLHLNSTPNSAKKIIYRSVPVTDSVHAFSFWKTEEYSFYFMTSNSHKEEAVIINLILKELFLKNSGQNAESPSQIVKKILHEIQDLSANGNIPELQKLITSILLVVIDTKSTKLIVSGMNQILFVNQGSDADNSKYKAFHIDVDHDSEILNPENSFLFSSNIVNSFSENEITSFLNEYYLSEKNINLTKAIAEFQNSQDFIIVNLST
ncbi:MAG: response regulator [Bacteroidales bacterium]|nr:response regulator [Bacteroidales bacterium]